MTITFRKKESAEYLDGALTITWHETLFAFVCLVLRMVTAAVIGWLFGYAKEAVLLMLLFDTYHGLTLKVKYSEDAK